VKITKKQFTVYSDIDLVNQNLKHSAFKLVSSMEEADILWLTTEYKHFAYLKAHQLCNQFPNESALTFKHLLPETLLKCHGSSALEYLPITYNMDTQLAAFIGEFTHRQKEGLDNSWIIKPWNLGRSLDLSISNNRDTLIRLSETGQKVAMKCNNNLLLSIHSHAPDISNPLLYEGRKFDLR
jgi:tubulin--tyrosine ligase-like protein 12